MRSNRVEFSVLETRLRQGHLRLCVGKSIRVNRGKIAVRILHACQELGNKTVAACQTWGRYSAFSIYILPSALSISFQQLQSIATIIHRVPEPFCPKSVRAGIHQSEAHFLV